MEPTYFGGDQAKRVRREYQISDCYLYTRAFNECLHDHPEASTRAALRECQVEFAFDLEHYYFCLTGIKKNIYYSVYGYEASAYLEIYDSFRRELMELVKKNGYKADIFIVMGEDTKQVAIIFSSGEAARCTPMGLAEKLGQSMQKRYEREIFKGDNRYCNVTALSPALSGFSQIREGYQLTRRLSETAFFRMVPELVTEQDVALRRNGADYPTVMDACIQLLGAVDEGDAAQADDLLNVLFLSLLRGSYSLPLCRDALSFLKSALQVRCTVYGLMDGLGLDDLCDVERYHKIEECAQALGQIFQRLCAAVREQGRYSKVVLHAAYYVKKHYAEDLSLPDVARYANVTATYLSNHFKENTGGTLRDYITATRIDAAKGLLVLGGKKVSEVAEAVGFYDAKYFTRTFKKFTGLSPAEYRSRPEKG